MRGRRPRTNPVNDDASPIRPLDVNAVGGSTIHWTPRTFRGCIPSDFRVQTLDGVADDWPIDYDELEPYYELNDRMIGVSGLPGDPRLPAARRGRRRRIPLGASGPDDRRGYDKLGWHWWPSRHAIATTRLRGRPQRCINCGPCDIGCPHGAKASDRRDLLAAGDRARGAAATRARVREITSTRTGWARGVALLRPGRRPSSPGGRRRDRRLPTASARRACCSTRARRSFPNGLANSSGLVGKNLMFHPVRARLAASSRASSTASKRAAGEPACSRASSSTRPTPRAASCAALVCRSCRGAGR